MKDKNSPLLLGTEPVGKLLLQYAIPAIIAMTASSLYNIADSIFIGHGVGALGIAGLALTFPLMNITAAFGSLAGVGASTLISIKLGQKDYKSSNKILGNVLTLNIVMGLALTAICLPLLNKVLIMFGASPDTIPYASEYMRVILIGNVITHLYFGLNSVLRSAGFANAAMYTILFSVVINCVLNPIFIFWLDWGIKGAAWATIISQFLPLIWQIMHFSKKERIVRFQKGIYKLKKDIVTDIFKIGLAPFLMNLCSSFIVSLINTGLKQHGGDMSIAAYGIVNRIAVLFVFIIMGLNQGMQPIAGYNFGARQFDRVKKATVLTVLWAVSISTLGFVICQFMPITIVKMFTFDKELIDAAVYGLHIVFAVFPIVAFQMVASNFFMSVGLSNKAIFMSLTRQLLFLIPLLIVLPHYFGTLGVWISLPVSDAIAACVAGVMIFRQFKMFGKGKNNFEL